MLSLLLNAVLDNVNLMSILSFNYNQLMYYEHKNTKKVDYRQKKRGNVLVFELFLVISQTERRYSSFSIKISLG